MKRGKLNGNTGRLRRIVRTILYLFRHGQSKQSVLFFCF